MAGRDIVTIGASSGGVEALSALVGGLPADLPAALLVVLHSPEGMPSSLPRILSRSGPLEAAHPEDGDGIENGRIYVAPPGFHMLVEDGVVRLVRGPRENYHRPAADPLFRSAAVARGPGVVGVVLTGARDDGTAGLVAIKRRGGVTVVQDPDDALFRWMPESALRYAEVDHSVPLVKMAPLLARLDAIGRALAADGDELLRHLGLGARHFADQHLALDLGGLFARRLVLEILADARRMHRGDHPRDVRVVADQAPLVQRWARERPGAVAIRYEHEDGESDHDHDHGHHHGHSHGHDHGHRRQRDRGPRLRLDPARLAPGLIGASRIALRS